MGHGSRTFGDAAARSALETSRDGQRAGGSTRWGARLAGGPLPIAPVPLERIWEAVLEGVLDRQARASALGPR